MSEAASRWEAGVPRVDPERRGAAVDRLRALRAVGELSTAHVRLAADGLGVAERTVWRWLGPELAAAATRYVLSDADREAFAYFRGNVAALARARAAVAAGLGQVAGAPVPDFLVAGWYGASAVTLRTLQRAFEREFTPAELAAWRTGEDGRRAASVYLTRPATGAWFGQDRQPRTRRRRSRRSWYSERTFGRHGAGTG